MPPRRSRAQAGSASPWPPRRARPEVDPENTLASFDRALADGCDGFEFDVRLTADGEAVVCHDRSLAESRSQRQRRRQLAALPKLQDLLARYRDRAFLDIELKVSGLEEITADLPPAASSPRLCGFFVSSRSVAAGAPCRWCDSPRVDLRDARAAPRLAPASGRIRNPAPQLSGQDVIAELRRRQRRHSVWTVNDPRDMKRLAEWGVDGIISDDTTLLCRTLSA